MLKYGITKSKIAHILTDNKAHLQDGYYYTKCELWARPTKFVDMLPEGTRMCKKCAKYMETENSDTKTN